MLLAGAAVVLVAGCSDGDPDSSSTTTTAGPSTETTAEPLAQQLIDESALPPEFRAADDIDDTITSFCAGEDATAGLSASARVIAGFNRQAPASSVVQVVFRFEGDDAAEFVAQTRAILDRCSEVPDLTGLAFAYEPASEAITGILASTDAHASSYGTSVGSGALTVNIAVFHRGKVGELVAVLGIDLPRSELDDLTGAALGAAVDRL